jgi:hypothetical protein
LVHNAHTGNGAGGGRGGHGTPWPASPLNHHNGTPGHPSHASHQSHLTQQGGHGAGGRTAKPWSPTRSPSNPQISHHPGKRKSLPISLFINNIRIQGHSVLTIDFTCISLRYVEPVVLPTSDKIGQTSKGGIK